jgi:predicted RNase H-like HicB family nuclease
MARIMMLVHETDRVFGATFPDFPGCTTIADSLDALVDKAPAVVAFHAEGLLEDGTLPRLRSLDEIWGDPLFQQDRADAVYVTHIDVDLPGRVVRVNVSVDEGSLQVIDRAAAAEGESRSGYLVKAALDRARGRVRNEGRA